MSLQGQLIFCVNILPHSSHKEKAFPKGLVNAGLKNEYESVILMNGGKSGQRRTMSMPNENQQNQNPEEKPEEMKYSFLQETIKSEPAGGRRLAVKIGRLALAGVFFGMCACMGFFALRPWAQDVFKGNMEQVTIPDDEDTVSGTSDSGEKMSQEEVQSSDGTEYEQITEDISKMAEEARKGVVSVEATSTETDENKKITDNIKSAAGAIIADNGQELLILTDSSVCTDTSGWSVVFNDGSRYDASFLSQDKNCGLAVLSVSRRSITDSTWSNAKVSVLGNSNTIKQGDPVIALGNMFGYSDGMSYGIVSSVSYKTEFYDGECTLISTDLPAMQGGTGVLFNTDGEVIGFLGAQTDAETGNRMFNAMAISGLKSRIEILANGESVPYVGIHGVTVTSQMQQENGLPEGIYVVDVDPESPAMSAGIQTGDIIYMVEDQEVSNITAYQSTVLEYKTGRQVSLRGRRLGSGEYVDINFTVTLGNKE